VLLCLFLSNRFSYLEIYHHRNKCFLFFFLFSFSPPRSLQVFDNSRENTVDPDSQMEHLAYNMELCRRTAALDPQHRRADKTMLVMHMKDFSIFNQPPMSVTKETVTILGTAFPESLGTCVILDPPPYFKVFWALVSPLIDPKTRSKVYLMSGDLGPGSPNDGLLNELIGPSWQELTGAGGAGVVASAFSPKHKKLVPCSPGFDPLQYWPSVLEREGAFAALVHQQLHEQQQQQQQKLQKLQFSAGGQQQQPQPQQGAFASSLPQPQSCCCFFCPLPSTSPFYSSSIRAARSCLNAQSAPSCCSFLTLSSLLLLLPLLLLLLLLRRRRRIAPLSPPVLVDVYHARKRR